MSIMVDLCWVERLMKKPRVLEAIPTYGGIGNNGSEGAQRALCVLRCIAPTCAHLLLPCTDAISQGRCYWALLPSSSSISALAYHIRGC